MAIGENIFKVAFATCGLKMRTSHHYDAFRLYCEIKCARGNERRRPAFFNSICRRAQVWREGDVGGQLMNSAAVWRQFSHMKPTCGEIRIKAKRNSPARPAGRQWYSRDRRGVRNMSIPTWRRLFIAA